jgi:membrane protein YdbS with pleckstrin-like domain
MAKPRISPGEQIIFQAQPGGWTLIAVYLITLGLYLIWRPATYFTVTDQRVIKSKGWLTRTAQTVPIRNIQDANVRIALGVGHVILAAAAGRLSLQRLGPMRAADAEGLTDAIVAQLARIGGIR